MLRTKTFETGVRGQASNRVCRQCGKSYSKDCQQCRKPYEEQRIKFELSPNLEDNG